MNYDEIENLATNLLVAVGAGWAASHGIDQATFSSVAGALVALIAGGYSIYTHWNKIKVSEHSIIIPPTPTVKNV